VACGSLHDVLEYLAAGMSEQQILGDLPDLEPDDIRAVLMLRPNANARCPRRLLDAVLLLGPFSRLITSTDS
jgi:hypothetical protein